MGRAMTATDIAAVHGMTPRHWTRLAAQGRIPGAWQPGGAGGKWLFDREPFETWLLSQITDPAAREAKRAELAGRRQREYARSQIKRKPLREDRPSDHVYFAVSGGMVKIGVSHSVTRRLHSFKTASPAPVVLVLTLPGSSALETELHQKFAAARSHGEWFRLTDELRAFIASHPTPAGCVSFEALE